MCVCSLAYAKLLTTVVSFLCAMLLYLVVFGTMFVAVCFLTAVLVHSTVMAGGDRSGRPETSHGSCSEAYLLAVGWLCMSCVVACGWQSGLTVPKVHPLCVVCFCKQPHHTHQRSRSRCSD